MRILRLILGVIGGAFAAMMVVTIAEYAGLRAYPPPPGLSTSDPAQMAEIVKKMPVAAMIYVLVGYAFGAYVGPAVAVLIADRRATAGWIVAILFVAATVYNLAVLPSPVWFNIAAMALELAAIALAVLPLSRKPALAPS